ncbi:MAG: hypothetical protein EOP10_24590 [Proteobacteria bacterium]|nr:MAG: hypothetical protein EOP10_24590 [Pseudomonadota bacterium]
MRWVIASVLMISILIFISQNKVQKMAAQKAEPTALPTTLKTPDDGTPEAKVAEITKELEESKPLLKVKEDVRAEVAKDPHGTSSALMKAGETVGQVAELEAAHPERKAEFQAYYKECFESSEMATVTRVQCFRRYVSSRQLSREETDKILESLPRPVQSLYRRAAATR